MLFELPPDSDPRLRHLAEYLTSKAPAGRLPGRQHIIPNEIPELLPYLTLLSIVERESGDLRYRFRLVGTHVVELFGFDPTGKFVEEALPPERTPDILKRYNQTVRTKRPTYHVGQFQQKGREHVRFERAAFPLARNGEDVDMLILIRVGVDARGNLYRHGDFHLR